MYKKYRETKAIQKDKTQSQDKSQLLKKEKPEWNFNTSDPDKYKLSPTEMVDIFLKHFKIYNLIK